MSSDEAASGVSTAWQGLAEGLSVTLAEMPNNCYIVLEEAQGRYAQFALINFDILVEVVGNSELREELQMSEIDSSKMIVDGWLPPGLESETNWRIVEAWPVKFNEYESMANKAVVALRDRLRVRSPGELFVQGWIEGSDDLPDVTSLGLRINDSSL